MTKQVNFFSVLNLKSNIQKSHGGSLRKGKRKTKRPLEAKKPLHLVLKSSKAVGKYSFLKSSHRVEVKNILYRQASKFGVRIQCYANVGNHLHLSLRFLNRRAFQNFLRSVSSLIARKVTQARRGHRFGKFWDGLAFTRVILSRRELHFLCKYIIANQIEGRSGSRAREVFLKQRNPWEQKIYFLN